MTLINCKVEDLTVTAMTVGDHFAIHPAILVDTATNELSLDTEVWSLEHLPSQKELCRLEQDDPIELPGEPRAINRDKVEAFVEWLESRIDCSRADLDLRTLSSDDVEVIRMFRSEPNYYTIPLPSDAR